MVLLIALQYLASLLKTVALLFSESGPQKVKVGQGVVTLSHDSRLEALFIFIQYFRFLFDISSVICWTQAKQERSNGENINRGRGELKNYQLRHSILQMQRMLILSSLGKSS